MSNKEDSRAESDLPPYTIPVGKIRCMIVDEGDYEWLSQYSWFPNSNKADRVYACSRLGGGASQKYVLAHRLITSPPSGLCVDHKNRDTLDNRRENLRICTYSQNSVNSKKRSSPRYTSRYKGVAKRIQPNGREGWVAKCSQRYLGYFRSELDAARAYDKAAREIMGEFAILNFQEEEDS